ncbi:MAG: DinB family protein [Vicinamibacteria bacterium]
MAAIAIDRPGRDEYSQPFARYVERVPEGALVAQLESQGADTARVLGALSEEQGAHRYAPDKWSVKQIVGHLTDAERIFSYRLLRFARKDETPLPGFDENPYVEAAEFDRRTLADLLAELACVREATLRLLRGLPAEAFARRGVASSGTLSVRALAYVVAGHELHHREVLKTRYGIG